MHAMKQNSINKSLSSQKSTKILRTIIINAFTDK